VGIEATDGFDALGGGEKRAFVDVIAHAHHDAVEEGEGAAHDAGVSDGEGVETAGKKRYFFGRSADLVPGLVRSVGRKRGHEGKT
jgi:hypothetical protein